MKTEQIQYLTHSFEAHAQQAETGVECWLARDIQHLLGYSKWDNFLNVVSKAKTACEVSGHAIQDHFADVGKMVDLDSGSQHEVLTLCSAAMLLEAERVSARKKLSSTKKELAAVIYQRTGSDRNFAVIQGQSGQL